MVFAADTLRNSIETNWALTGNLSKTAADNMKEVVRFFAHPQIPGRELTKTISVRKINTAEQENETEWPDYSEIHDVFEITCRIRIRDTGEVSYDQAESDIEDMTEEVRRIVKTVYSPSAGAGNFHRARWTWSKRDTFESGEPELIRVLTLTLFNIVSKSTEVFDGFGGVLTFDLSASDNMDTAPAGDYIYTEAHEVRIREGTSVTEALGKDTANGARVPKLGAGRFRGTFNANIFAKKSDIGASDEKLDKIYLLQTNGQHVEAAFLHTVPNTEGTPVTLSQTSFVKVTSMMKISNDTDLVGFNLEGRLIKPSTFALT